MKQYQEQPDNSNWVDRSPFFDAALKVLFGLCIASIFYLKTPFTMEQAAYFYADHPWLICFVCFILVCGIATACLHLTASKQENDNTGDDYPILDLHEEMISK